jgi:hypothetical protein
VSEFEKRLYNKGHLGIEGCHLRPNPMDKKHREDMRYTWGDYRVLATQQLIAEVCVLTVMKRTIMHTNVIFHHLPPRYLHPHSYSPFHPVTPPHILVGQSVTP